jgi:hypothetical protein
VLRFTDVQRLKLAVNARVLGRRLLDGLETLVTPDTLFDWRRKLIAKMWTHARKGWGRPRIAPEITDWVLVGLGECLLGLFRFHFKGCPCGVQQSKHTFG